MFLNNIAKLFMPPPVQRIGFEDVLVAIKSDRLSSSMFLPHAAQNIILLNTLDAGSQSVLIPKTMPILQEEAKINEWLEKREYKTNIIVYGRHAADDTADKKYAQLRGLGFSNVFVYSGGIFEWCLLQDIYGAKQFPTTAAVKDMLVYKPPCVFNPLVQRLGW